MTDSQYEYLTTLQYRVKNLKDRLEAFESGAIYKKMEEDYKSLLHTEENRIKKLEKELLKANAEISRARNRWLKVLDDTCDGYERQLATKDKRIRELEERVLVVERQRDSALDKIKDQRLELYDVKTALEEELGKNLKLTAQINRDYENSSKPSSQSPNHKKISNSRKKQDAVREDNPVIKDMVAKSRRYHRKPLYSPLPKKPLTIRTLRKQAS